MSQCNMKMALGFEPSLAENLMEEVISDDEETSRKNARKSGSNRAVDKRKRGLQYPEG